MEDQLTALLDIGLPLGASSGILSYPIVVFWMLKHEDHYNSHFDIAFLAGLTSVIIALLLIMWFIFIPLAILMGLTTLLVKGMDKTMKKNSP